MTTSFSSLSPSRRRSAWRRCSSGGVSSSTARAFSRAFLPRSSSSFGKDVLFSIYLEMLRIYTHPFLAGCSIPLLLEDSDFLTEFASASGKVMVLNQIITGMAKVAKKKRMKSRSANAVSLACTRKRSDFAPFWRSTIPCWATLSNRFT